MKRRVLYKICNTILFAVSILLAWGGMIYATKNPDQVRIIGLLISFLGYGLFFVAVLQYENREENPS